jgi:hypothetical protein
MTQDPKTIVAFKLRGGRFYRDVVKVMLIFSLLMLPFAALASVQLYLCWSVKPDASFLDCIAPRRLR